jgi:hypothetical protein
LRRVRAGDPVPGDREGEVLRPGRAGERLLEKSGWSKDAVLRKLDRLVFRKDDQPNVVNVREACEVVEPEVEQQR